MLHGNPSQHTNNQMTGHSVGPAPGAGVISATGHHHEGASRILSAETLDHRVQKKAIIDLLQEIITNRSAKGTNELSNLKFDNDLVTTFFDKISLLSDDFTFSFIEELKKDVTLSVINTLRSTQLWPLCSSLPTK